MRTKRIFSALAMLLTCMAGANATDVITVDDVIVPKGGEVTLEIGSSFETTFIAFQLDIELADGLTLQEDEDGVVAALGGSGTNHTFSAGKQGNVYTLTCASMTNRALPAGDVLMSVVLQADASLETGTVIPAAIKNIIFSEKQDDNQIKHTLDDVSFNITVGEPDDGRIKFDEAATKLPKYTAGEKGDVTMKRTISADTWSTIVLPFTLTKAKAEAAFGSDVQLAEFAGFEVDYGEDEDNDVPLSITVNFSPYTMSSKKSMTGGKPFLIKTSTEITSFTADDVTLFDEVTDVNKTDEYDTNGKFTGTLVKTKVPEDGLFLYQNQFWYSTGETSIKAFRGWFDLGAVLDKATDFSVKIYIFIDGEETKIEGLESEMPIDDVYDMTGRKVSKPGQKGIYIVGGKKILFK